MKIRVIGLGGGGGSMVNRIARKRNPNVEYLAINTDASTTMRFPRKPKMGLTEVLKYAILDIA